MENKPGDANRITREFFDSLLIEMRHVGAVLPDTSMTLYGENFSTPIMTAALSHLDKFGYHPDGMVELAKGAKAADAVMWAGMGSFEELERICATGAKTIKIIKPYADNDLIFKKIAHAEECGCIAVGMDIDHSFNRRGEYDVIDGVQMTGKTQEEINQFATATRLPFIVKGVLSVHDAVKCMEAGVQGIVVSHHHGILNYAVPPLMVLPQIMDVVKGRMQVFVDCGIESGYDVFKALALGANAVSLGRIILEPLREKGADGAAEMIREMTGELAGAMARTGAGGVFGIDRSVVWGM
ncbi:MAG: alpha-hydroxy-acid oxidizing protein [Defluviitaleaceae bacterium]|nr:alpha-hydroxy-acid oxidizing protein [Defluviitaleaceae bacterium]